METKTGVQVIGSVVLGVALTITGCGGNGGGSCGVDPCGGDVVGIWQAASSCVNRAVITEEFQAEFMNICPEVTLGAVSVTPTGSINFMSDLNYSGNMALSTSVTMNFPAACLMGQPCSALDAALQGSVGTSGIVSAACTGTSACACTLVQSLTDLLPSPGTYTTAANDLTVLGADGSMDGGPYCVQGSRLHLIDVGTDMGGMMRIESDIVFNRQ